MTRIITSVFVSLLLVGCSSTTTSTTSGGSPSSSGNGDTTSGTEDAGVGSSKSGPERYCAGICAPSPASCAAEPAAACYAALSSDAILAKLDACAAAGKCGIGACDLGSAAAKAYVSACQTKAGACGGSIDGLSASDCGDVAPLFRDDVLGVATKCFEQSCSNVTACLTDAIRSAEPTACGSL